MSRALPVPPAAFAEAPADGSTYAEVTADESALSAPAYAKATADRSADRSALSVPAPADTPAEARGAKAEKSLKARQERFCQAFVVYGTAATAAAEAGYAPASARKQGWRLMRIARIGARVAEIQAALVGEHWLRPDVLAGKLENIHRRAVGDHQFHAAVRAVEAQARLAGHLPSRRSPGDAGPACRGLGEDGGNAHK